MKINILANDQKTIIDLIDQISDDNLKRKIITACIEKEKEDNSNIIDGIPIEQGYSLQAVLKRMETTWSSRPIDIKDLKWRLITLN